MTAVSTSDKLFGGVLNNGPTIAQIPPSARQFMDHEREITHIEIRRVQNGFVVMAINMKVYTAQRGFEEPLRWSFVAKDTAELGALLASIVDGGCDLKWVPSYDLPIVQLTRQIPEPK